MTWKIVLADEVAQWVETLTPQDLKVVQRMFDMLSLEGNRLRMPHSKPLGHGLFELRFDIKRGTVAQRVTYFFDTARMVICVTPFNKSRRTEPGEIARARHAMADYQQQNEER